MGRLISPDLLASVYRQIASQVTERAVRMSLDLMPRRGYSWRGRETGPSLVYRKRGFEGTVYGRNVRLKEGDLSG